MIVEEETCVKPAVAPCNSILRDPTGESCASPLGESCASPLGESCGAPLVKSCSWTDPHKPVCADGPSLGLTLIMSIMMFGIDRFYVGQTGLGVAFLIGCLTGVGFIVVVPIQIIAWFSLIMSILGNRETAFMYGCVKFAPPNVVDKIIAIAWLTIILVGIAVGVLAPLIF